MQEWLFLAVPDLGTHATFSATEFSSPFSGFFRSHLNCSPEWQMCPAEFVPNTTRLSQRILKAQHDSKQLAFWAIVDQEHS